MPDSVHTCVACMDGDINCILSVGIELDLLPKFKKLNLKWNTSLNHTTKLVDFYISIDPLEGPAVDFGFGECPHNYYKVTVNMGEVENGGDPVPFPGGEFTINGVRTFTDTDNDGKIFVYVQDGKHDCSALFNNTYTSNGSFTVAKKACKLDFCIYSRTVTDENGDITKEYSDVSYEPGNDVTTITTTTTMTTTETTEETTTTFVEKEYAIIEHGRLGDNIYYTLYGDGFLYIYGYGEMYDFSSCPFTLRDKIIDVQIENGGGDMDETEVITSIGNGLFSGCSNMTYIEIPDSVTSIGDFAFASCDSMTGCTIPDSVVSIGNGAFLDCYSIPEITIPNSVTSIGYSAFENCTNLSDIHIGSGVERIGNSAFFWCIGLTSITIIGDATTIGDGAFNGCTGLISITIIGGVTTIGEDVFRGCTELTNVASRISIRTSSSTAYLNIPFDNFEITLSFSAAIHSASFGTSTSDFLEIFLAARKNFNAASMSSERFVYTLSSRYLSHSASRSLLILIPVLIFSSAIIRHSFDI